MYDPVALSRLVEERVSRRRGRSVERKYWRFRHSRHYGGNNAGDVVGCNLRCAFCWAWRFAHTTEPGRFYTPGEAARRIAQTGRARIARLTGGEPTIAWEHTREVILRLARIGFLFVLETNGILIGSGDVPVEEIPRNTHVRISLKAPDEESFHAATGARPESFRLQLRAVELLAERLEPGRDFHVALVMGVAPPRRYSRIVEWLASVNRRLVETLEPEYIVLYPHVVKLMRLRGFKPYYAIEPG